MAVNLEASILHAFAKGMKRRAFLAPLCAGTNTFSVMSVRRS